MAISNTNPMEPRKHRNTDEMSVKNHFYTPDTKSTVKFTLDMDAGLHTELKLLAAGLRTSMKTIAHTAIKQYLEQTREVHKPQ